MGTLLFAKKARVTLLCSKMASVDLMTWCGTRLICRLYLSGDSISLNIVFFKQKAIVFSFSCQQIQTDPFSAYSYFRNRVFQLIHLSVHILREALYDSFCRDYIPGEGA